MRARHSLAVAKSNWLRAFDGASAFAVVAGVEHGEDLLGAAGDVEGFHGFDGVKRDAGSGWEVAASRRSLSLGSSRRPRRRMAMAAMRRPCVRRGR